MKVQAGSVLGPYRIDVELGRGGMATVFKAYQPSLDRFVAIKVLPEFFSDDPDFKERFQQEAIAVAKLRHPNIPVVHDYGESDGVTYIVSEYIDGGTLTDKLGEPLSTRYMLKILSGVSAALDYAHSKGVLHRDVKPSNVLIDAGGTPRLADFGLAKIMGSDSNRLTKTGTIVGTPEYMSPEQCEGQTLTAASDVYALAVVAYEMLTGRPPFLGPTPVAVILAQVKDPLPSPRSLNHDITPAIERVLLKALAKDPNDRQATCGDFVRELEAADTVPAAGSQSEGGVSDASLVRTSDAVTSHRLSRRRRLDWIRQMSVGLGPKSTQRADVDPDSRGSSAADAPSESEPVAPSSEHDSELMTAELADERPSPAATLPGNSSGPSRFTRRNRLSGFLPIPRDPDPTSGPKSPHRASFAIRIAAMSAIVLVGGVLLVSRMYVPGPNQPTAEHLAGPSTTPQPTPSPSSSTETPAAVTAAGSLLPRPSLRPSFEGFAVIGGQQWAVAGSHFSPGQHVTVNFYDPVGSKNWSREWLATVKSDGTFTATGLITNPSGSVGQFIACDGKGLCAAVTVQLH